MADRPPVFRFALSEQEPLPPAVANLTAGFLPIPIEAPTNPPSPVEEPAVPTTEMEAAVPVAHPVADSSAPTTLPVDPTAPSPSPFLNTSAFQLPPLPAELLGTAPAPAAVAPPPAEAPAAVAPAEPASAPPIAEEPAVFSPALADRAPFTLSPAAPTADQRAAFASVFAPSALARTPDGSGPPLGEMDSLPAIALAKLPPLEIPSSSAPVEPDLPIPAAADPPAADPPVEEDLSFGYVDNSSQLALRAIFATDRTLDTQDVVDLAAGLEGLRACLVHTPHASLHSAGSSNDPDDVRHFRERASILFEKTASLVRELDPAAREQCFTLRTGKGVASFFAVDDVCLAVLHGEPSFRPGVREKLTLVARSVAEMLAA